MQNTPVATFTGHWQWNFSTGTNKLSFITGETLYDPVAIPSGNLTTTNYSRSLPAGWPSTVTSCVLEVLNDNSDPIIELSLGNATLTANAGGIQTFSLSNGGTISFSKTQTEAITVQLANANGTYNRLPALNPFQSYGFRVIFFTSQGGSFSATTSLKAESMQLFYATYGTTGHGYAGSTSTYNTAYFDLETLQFYIISALPRSTPYVIQSAGMEFVINTAPQAQSVLFFSTSPPQITGTYASLIKSVHFAPKITIDSSSGLYLITCTGTLNSSSLVPLAFIPVQGNLYQT